MRKIYLTKLKISIAKILFKIIKIFIKNSIVNVRRNKINFKLDLTEGIDFSIFLFGSFQKNIFNNTLIDLESKKRIIDIGANIGAMTLNFARLSHPDSKVLAIEPTDYAYGKLIQNLNLNSDLSSKIETENCFIGSENKKSNELKVYSSWKIDDTSKNSHPIHGGSSFSVDQHKIKSLDNLILEKKWHSVDLIKIDTDGFEWEVINSSLKLINTYHPVLIIEFGKYALEEKGAKLSNFVVLLKGFGYRAYSLNGKFLDWDKFEEFIPENYTVDLIFIYSN